MQVWRLSSLARFINIELQKALPHKTAKQIKNKRKQPQYKEILEQISKNKHSAREEIPVSRESNTSAVDSDQSRHDKIGEEMNIEEMLHSIICENETLSLQSISCDYAKQMIEHNNNDKWNEILEILMTKCCKTKRSQHKKSKTSNKSKRKKKKGR